MQELLCCLVVRVVAFVVCCIVAVATENTVYSVCAYFSLSLSVCICSVPCRSVVVARPPFLFYSLVQVPRGPASFHAYERIFSTYLVNPT